MKRKVILIGSGYQESSILISKKLEEIASENSKVLIVNNTIENKLDSSYLKYVPKPPTIDAVIPFDKPKSKYHK